MQGVAIAERAYQHARGLCAGAGAGRVVGAAKGAAASSIARPPGCAAHADDDARACTEAARALGYVTAAALDHAHRHPSAEVRRRELAFAELMIPIVKGWSTELAQKTPLWASRSTAAGLHRGTGAAQYLRDARITTIYEGTTGIQANDLIGRKLARDGGKSAG